MAGTGEYGSTGDDGLAISAQLNSPTAVTVDGNGNVVIADTYNDLVRLVTRSGIITTVAGSYCATNNDDSRCTLGDGGAATNAHLRHPQGVAIDTFNKLYIVEGGNNFGRVRLVTTSGIISTFAGIGFSFGGDIGDGGPATLARLNYPQAIAIDISGKLYIADSNNYRIRVVSTTGGIITTFAGTGTSGSDGDGGLAISAQLKYPYGIAVDTSGTVYISENSMSYQKIRKVSGGGIITTYAGTGTSGSSGDGGAATSATLSYCTGLAVDASFNLYIADAMNNEIRLVTYATGIIITFAGGYSNYGSFHDGGPATNGVLMAPWGVAVDSSGNVYIADSGNNLVRKVTSTWNYPTSQPSTQPSIQPSTQPTMEPSNGIWQPKHQVRVFVILCIQYI